MQAEELDDKNTSILIEIIHNFTSLQTLDVKIHSTINETNSKAITTALENRHRKLGSGNRLHLRVSNQQSLQYSYNAQDLENITHEQEKDLNIQKQPDKINKANQLSKEEQQRLPEPAEQKRLDDLKAEFEKEKALKSATKIKRTTWAQKKQRDAEKENIRPNLQLSSTHQDKNNYLQSINQCPITSTKLEALQKVKNTVKACKNNTHQRTSSLITKPQVDTKNSRNKTPIMTLQKARNEAKEKKKERNQTDHPGFAAIKTLEELLKKN